MSPAATEWLNLLLRWLHVVAAVYWVGQTYLFAWLDGRFAAAQRAGRDEPVWMVHSGGFYAARRISRPDAMPPRLYWTWWESVLTWTSGAGLLVVVYYMGGLMLPAGSSLGHGTAIALAVGAMAMGWILYDGLWISPLGQREGLAVTISFVLLMGVSWVLLANLGGRAAFMHVGATLGTIMALNVWLRILPSQRQMVAALRDGGELDQPRAERAKQRSRHNGFLAVPVVLIMISNHFPTTTYGSPRALFMLAIFIVAGWAARWAIKAIEN